MVVGVSIDGLGLLERAVNYTLGSLHLVRDEQFDRPTPCAEWDLAALLGHLNDSLAALLEAVQAEHVRLDPSAPDPGAPAHPVRRARQRATALLGAWTNSEAGTVWVADRPLQACVIAGTGAVELTAHGWDIAVACGDRRPVPHELAEQILRLAPLVVTEADRPERFADPVAIPRQATPGDRLIAFLGRQP